MDSEQQKAVNYAAQRRSFFLTGAGGTGKSFVIQHIVDAIERSGRDVALTAMTGCAALLLGSNAKTLHSWAGIGLGKESVDILVPKIKKSNKARKNWLAADCLIIDEVSMMTPDLLDKLEAIAKLIKKNKAPFGGLQVILVGDLYQLPPIYKEGQMDPEKGQFVFESQSWRNYIKDVVVLDKVHRQSDPVFLQILNEARAGDLSEESIKILESRKTNAWKKLEIKPTLLFTRRADVDDVNVAQLQKCPGEDVVYKVKTVKLPNVFATEQDIQWTVERMDKNSPYVPELRLRKGAQVMLLTNKHTEYKLVNGSRGVIIGFSDDNDKKRLAELQTADKTPEVEKQMKDLKMQLEQSSHLPIVKFKSGGTLVIDYHAWESDEIKGLQREQIPLRLAYAVTIHKAQGATLDCALVDIGDNTFEYGQAYVALSRVKSLDSLYIWDLNPSAFRVHPKVKAYLDSLPTPNEETEMTDQLQLQSSETVPEVHPAYTERTVIVSKIE
jgi:ATP-dependent DNA helicase PIF1